jgi:hypothetical protein
MFISRVIKKNGHILFLLSNLEENSYPYFIKKLKNKAFFQYYFNFFKKLYFLTHTIELGS